MKTGIVYGTWDTLHFGHIEALKYVAKQVDYLIVAVSTDDFNKTKKKKALIPYWQRRELIDSLIFVNEVIPEYSWEQKITDIEKYHIDRIFVDEEWRRRCAEDIEYKVPVLPIPRTPNISSTEIRGKL